MKKYISLNIVFILIWFAHAAPAHAPAISFPDKCQPEINTPSPLKLKVSVKKQLLYVYKNQSVIINYPVSTSKYGTGNKQGSNKTPLGLHKIKDMIGKGAPLGTIFRARVNTGKKAEILKAPVDQEEDLVTTRILRLEGLEAGKNKGPGIDSYTRYIYIHGTPEEGLIGQQASHGCIRMKNKDVIELFNMVEVGTRVLIEA